MFTYSIFNIILIGVLSFTLLLLSIGMLLSLRFQKKQQKRYNEVIKIVNEKKDEVINVKSGLTEEEIYKVDPDVNIQSLTTELFDKFKGLQLKIKNHDSNNIENLATTPTLEFVKSRIDAYKNNGYYEVMDDIELQGYSIIEFEKEKLKLRIHVVCKNYKKLGDEVISGSDIKPIEEIIIIEYVKIDDNWVIIDVDKVLERKIAN